MTTKIQINQHLAEYCLAKWGDEQDIVKFPDSTELYVKIHDLMQKRPEYCPVDQGNLEFCIPNRRKTDDQATRKNPEIYNYLSPRSVKIIERRIETIMWAELHEYLDYQKHKNGVEYIETIHEFRCKYCIESISEDAMLKNYYRWREKVRKRNKRQYRTSVLK